VLVWVLESVSVSVPRLAQVWVLESVSVSVPRLAQVWVLMLELVQVCLKLT
jgi:hypothetical protein